MEGSHSMSRGRRAERNLTVAQQMFNTATAAVGGLYLGTHSVVVTITGSTAAAVVTCLAVWLEHWRRQAIMLQHRPAAAEDPQVSKGYSAPAETDVP